jgi:hypothetical protein
MLLEGRPPPDGVLRPDPFRHREARSDAAFRTTSTTPGFCRAVKLAEIAEHGYVLTPGRHVGAEAPDDDEAFNEKMDRLTAQLAERVSVLRDTLLPRLISGTLRLPEARSNWKTLSHEAPARPGSNACPDRIGTHCQSLPNPLC